MKRLLMAAMIVPFVLSVMVTPGMSGQVRAAPERNQAAAVHTAAHPAAFDKTRFVAHLAVAAFLVHYIYKKYKQGKLGRTHIVTDIKAAVAALFAYHEMKTAYDIAKTSNSKTLQILISPMTKLTSTLSSMASKLKHGDTSDIANANDQANLLQTTAGKNGYAYQDQQPAKFNPGF